MTLNSVLTDWINEAPSMGILLTNKKERGKEQLYLLYAFVSFLAVTLFKIPVLCLNTVRFCYHYSSNVRIRAEDVWEQSVENIYT